MAKWYIHEHDRVSGPFSAGEMRSKVEAGEVTANTMIRKDSHTKFLAAKSFQGLIKDNPAQPPAEATAADKASEELQLDEAAQTDAGSDTKLPTADPDKHQTTLKDGDHLPGMNTTMATGDLGGPPTELLDTRETEPVKNPETIGSAKIEADKSKPRTLLMLTKLYLPVGFLALIVIIYFAARM